MIEMIDGLIDYIDGDVGVEIVFWLIVANVAQFGVALIMLALLY